MVKLLQYCVIILSLIVINKYIIAQFSDGFRNFYLEIRICLAIYDVIKKNSSKLSLIRKNSNQL